ncbi:hypothetical protein [Mycobacterium europaeum]|uniref:hypothetical protein n=1 Tax=Mycobacterium europaeum TaxID=761804 RepID=UPI00114696CA|nr:hypothetical protein [Mycobacterium europaeum]
MSSDVVELMAMPIGTSVVTPMPMMKLGTRRRSAGRSRTMAVFLQACTSMATAKMTALFERAIHTG